MTSGRIKDFFKKRFRSEPEILVKAPGRINIMGEHTDYNQGYVLPATINYYMTLALARNHTNQINIYAIDYKEEVTQPLHEIVRVDRGWQNLINGVADQLKQHIGGFDIAFGGNIPNGAGVSSSAAICCGLTYGLSELFELGLDRWSMAKIAQESEHKWAMVQCGIMDQFACLFGLTNHALKLDCLTLQHEFFEFDLSGYKFTLINSNVPHDLNESAYNDRRNESRRALDRIRSLDASVRTYQDLDMQKLLSLESHMDDLIWRRARHVVTDNERVHRVGRSLSERAFEEVGRLLTESHFSEKNDYEITCAQTDYLVEEMVQNDLVLGARQIGGGFGGCVLGLVKDHGISDFLIDINERYKKRFGRSFAHIPIKVSRGCHLVDN